MEQPEQHAPRTALRALPDTECADPCFEIAVTQEIVVDVLGVHRQNIVQEGREAAGEDDEEELDNL